jgi:dUTP pyrophosphatase
VDFLNVEMDSKHIQKIIKEFNFLNRKNKHPNECPCYKDKPCHNLPELNCFLCYCPEYKSKIEGGCKINNPNGKWLFNEKLPKGKIWDCSNCDYPHREEIVEKYLKSIFLSKNKMQIKIKKLHRDAIIPKYAHEGDAGMDIYSIEDTIMPAGERAIISTGITIELPKDYVSLIWDRSSLAVNGVTTMGGVIDSGYRGEYKIILFNASNDDYVIKKGQKIAQILIQKVETAEIKQVEELTESSRGEGRFGSTGL